MLAYYVEWHMRQKLKPILFDDHDKAAADAARPSVVAKAKRSEAAQRKARNRCTDDGLPVHSFRSLLADLATVTRNVMAMDGAPEASFVLLSATHPRPGPRLPAARPRRQSVASPATHEFKIRQADQWFALWTGGNFGLETAWVARPCGNMGTRSAAPGGAALHGGYSPKSGYDVALRYVKS